MPFDDRLGKVTLNGVEYPLATRKDAEGNWVAREWSRTPKPQAIKRERRANIYPGEIEGEFCAVYDNWNMGVVGDGEDRLGGLYLAAGIHGLTPNKLSIAHAITAVTHTTEENVRPVWSGMFNNEFFVVAGRYCKRYANGAQTIDRDFGAGIYATDAIVWGVSGTTYLVVCFGGSTNIVQWRNAAGNWNTVLAGGLVYADHFSLVEDRLSRITSTNQVSTIANGADPTLFANWGGGLTVGDTSSGCTDLNAVGERYVISKPEGMFLGDRNAIFPNAFPQLELAPNPLNGRNTWVHGSDIYYPIPSDLLRYNSETEQVESVGLQHSLPTAGTADDLPSCKVSAITSEGLHLWAVTESAGFPRIRPTSVKKTIDSGTSYTTYTVPFAADLSSLDTVANGDWMIVGFAAGVAVYGLVIEVSAANSNVAAMTVEYWNGSAWTAFAVIDDVWDGTRVPTLATPMVPGTISLQQSGQVTWAVAPTTVAATIDTVSAHWYRVSFSAALDATTTLASIWGITVANTPGSALSQTDVPGAWLFRLRERQAGDNSPTPVVWEPYVKLPNNPKPSTISFIPSFAYPHTRRYGQLVVAGKQRTQFISPPTESTDEPYSDLGAIGSWAIQPFDDMGTPGRTKYFRGVRHYLRNALNTNLMPTLLYRTSGTAVFSNAGTGTAEGAIAVTGTQIQLGFGLTTRPDVYALSAGGASSGEVWPEWFCVEVRFREVPDHKDEFVVPIELRAGPKDDPNVFLALLDALIDAGTAVAWIDPTRLAYSAVTVLGIQNTESYTNELGYPSLSVTLRLAEA